MLSHYLPGYCLVQVITGGELERFINLATQRNINIWNIRDLGAGILSAEVSLGSLRALRFVAQATNCSLEIVEKHGLPLAIRHFRRQKTFVFGILISCLLLFLFSRYIFGKYRNKTGGRGGRSEKILMIAALWKDQPYSFAWNIDWQSTAEEILRETDPFSWSRF